LLDILFCNLAQLLRDLEGLLLGHGLLLVQRTNRKKSKPCCDRGIANNHPHNHNGAWATRRR
jgi:hypothetical protein